VTGDYHYYPSASPIVSVCRASERAIWTDRRCCCCGGGGGTAEKLLSASSLQHTRAIARQGDQRLLAGHLAAPAAERDGRNVTRDTHCGRRRPKFSINRVLAAAHFLVDCVCYD